MQRDFGGGGERWGYRPNRRPAINDGATNYASPLKRAHISNFARQRKIAYFRRPIRNRKLSCFLLFSAHLCSILY